MLDPAIVAYRRHPDVDAAQELRALGLSVAETFLVHWQDVVAGRIDHWTYQPFDMFSGVPVYKVEKQQRFAIYAVLDEPDDSVTVTVMLAARRGDATLGGHVWDGTDMAFVRHTVLQPRLADYFHLKPRHMP